MGEFQTANLLNFRPGLEELETLLSVQVELRTQAISADTLLRKNKSKPCEGNPLCYYILRLFAYTARSNIPKEL